MYGNVGRTMKSIASVIAILGIGVSVIFGFGIMVSASEAFWVALVLMIAGALISWISSMGLYAFGELVDQNLRQTELLQDMLYTVGTAQVGPVGGNGGPSNYGGAPSGQPPYGEIDMRTPVADTWICRNCGTENKTCYGQCKKCAANRR